MTPIYHYRPSGKRDSTATITGVKDRPLSGLEAVSADLAPAIAQHLNYAYGGGRLEVQAELKKALGL